MTGGGKTGGKVENSEFYYCTECRFLVARAAIKYVEETPALFEGMPTMVRFLCPRCEALVTVEEELI